RVTRRSQSAFKKLLGIGVTKLALDVFAIALDRYTAKPQFFCDSPGAETLSYKMEHMQLAISQAGDGGVTTRLAERSVSFRLRLGTNFAGSRDFKRCDKLSRTHMFREARRSSSVKNA